MNRIIIGYDGSPQSDDALELGRVLADTTGARPLIVGVADWPSYLVEPADPQEALHAHLDPVLDNAYSKLSALEPETYAISGPSVAQALMETAEREKAKAIVVGSSHRGALGRVTLGSVATSLVHGAPCAVTVAPPGLAAAHASLLSIGVAFDGSPEAWSALETGIGIAERTHGKLTVVTCADFPAYGLSAAWTVYTAAQIVDVEKREKERVLELALGRVPRGLHVEGRVLSGPAGKLLTEVSSEFDLLLLGSRGYGAIGRTFLGGVASHVMHAARCPVMVLPRGAGSDPLGTNAASRLEERV